jgi:hypothetical protein
MSETEVERAWSGEGTKAEEVGESSAGTAKEGSFRYKMIR